MTYSDKVKKALSDCSNIEEVTEVEQAVQVTKQINRRTKKGRGLTQQLLAECNKRANELINKHNIQPF